MKNRLFNSRKRVLFIFGIFIILIVLLVFRTAWIQIIRGKEYSEKAVAQQTADIPVKAKRGNILDRNGKELATSAACYNLWVRPGTIKQEYSQQKIESISNDLAVIIDMDAKDVKDYLTADKGLIQVKKYLDMDAANKIKALKIHGFEIVEDTKRYYPMGDFASVVLGSVNDEDVGRSGIEQQYNDYLSGIAGRWVKDTDIQGNTLSYGEKKFYRAEDGFNVVLTIDEMLQHYLETVLQDGMKKHKASQAWGMVMNPKTGEVLAMAKDPSFDPNNPMRPSDKKDYEKYKKMKDDEKVAYINKLWRNPMISDAYEPGSTFKLLVSSEMLEEGLATPETHFVCKQAINVDGVNLHCWSNVAHGSISLNEAVGVSCNPAHVQMALKLGPDKFYDYLHLYGMTEPTGIDLPAEGSPIIKKKEDLTRVDFATMGFGQGMAVTPVQLLTAISGIGNDGVMMKPHVVKELTDSNGKVVKKFEPTEIRRILSEQTASEMKMIIEDEVKLYGGKTAKISGYRIGGKTGTANIATDEGTYGSRLYCSFVCLAPVNDPELAVLIILETGPGMEGNFTAAPMVKDFLTKALPYMKVPRDDSETEDKEKTVVQYVPSVSGMTYSKATSTLAQYDLKPELKPALTDAEKKSQNDIKIVDQYPKAGKKIEKGSTVVLYRE